MSTGGSFASWSVCSAPAPIKAPSTCNPLAQKRNNSCCKIVRIDIPFQLKDFVCHSRREHSTNRVLVVVNRSRSLLWTFPQLTGVCTCALIGQDRGNIFAPCSHTFAAPNSGHLYRVRFEEYQEASKHYPGIPSHFQQDLSAYLGLLQDLAPQILRNRAPTISEPKISDRRQKGAERPSSDSSGKGIS